MKTRIIGFFTKFFDLNLFVLMVSLIAGFCILDCPEGQSFLACRPRFHESLSPGNPQFFTFVSIIAAMVLALPLSIVGLSRVLTGSFERGWIWLRFLWISLAIALLMLAAKITVFDTFLADFPDFYSFSGSLPHIFGFSMTLYAFVAGFILLYCLQEYSTISRDFKQEIGAWHALFDLLRFFRKQEGAPSTKLKDRAANHIAALDGMRLISEIEIVETKAGEPPAPEKALDKLYGVILRLKTLDDNDGPALEAVIHRFANLRILLHERRDKSVRSPSMLVFVVWIVAIINTIFASLAVLSLFEFCPEPSAAAKACEYGPRVAIERLYLAVSITVMVLPITMINLTIYDLRSPFDGDWKIDVKKAYETLSQELKRALLLS